MATVQVALSEIAEEQAPKTATEDTAKDTSLIDAGDHSGLESRADAVDEDAVESSSEDEDDAGDDEECEEDEYEDEDEACDSDASTGSQIRWTDEDQLQWNSEVDRDYYVALGLSRTSVHISASRVRAAYHKLAFRLHPRKAIRRHQVFDEESLAKSAEPEVVLYKKRRREAKLEALRRFWALTEAFLVLKDPERKRIYDECGLEGLRKSESCYAEPVFEKDAYEVYEAFFAGEDPEDREFLLMNGGGQNESSDDEGSDAENDEDLDELARSAVRAARAASDRAEAAGEDPEAVGVAAGRAFASTMETKRRRTGDVEALLPAEMRGQVLGSASSSSSSTAVEAEWSSLVNDALSRAARQAKDSQKTAQLDEVPGSLELPSSIPKEVPVVRGGDRQDEHDVPVEETSVSKADASSLTAAESSVEVPTAAADLLAPLPAELPAATHTSAEVPAVEVPAPQVPAAVIPPAEVLEVEVPSVADLLEQHFAAEVETAEVPVIEVPSVSSGQAPPTQADELCQAEVPAAEVLAMELSPRRHPLAEASSAEHSVEEIPTILIPAARQPELLLHVATEEVTPVPANVVPAAEQTSLQLGLPPAEMSVVDVPTKETPAMVLLPSDEAPATPMLEASPEPDTSIPVLAPLSLKPSRKRRLHASRSVHIWRGALATMSTTAALRLAKRPRGNGVACLASTHS